MDLSPILFPPAFAGKDSIIGDALPLTGCHCPTHPALVIALLDPRPESSTHEATDEPNCRSSLPQVAELSSQPHCPS